MRRTVGTIAAAPALLLAGAASSFAANDKVRVTPYTYDPFETGIIVSGWQPHTGLPDASGTADQGLVLQKNAATSTWASAGAVVSGVEGQQLTELGFDYKSDGHCGAGSPRFNVTTTDGVTHFLGCIYGTHEPDAPAAGWTRVRFTGSDLPAGVVKSIAIVADEQGQSVIDNVDVNGTLAGSPGNAG